MGPAGGLREVEFTSQACAEARTPGPGEAIVSITNAGVPPAALRPGWRVELRLAFDDVDPFGADADVGDKAVAMRSDQARQVADFVLGLPLDCTRLVIHCRYGQSRSAAMARAVCGRLGLPFPADWEYDNRHVYELVRKALEPGAR